MKMCHFILGIASFFFAFNAFGGDIETLLTKKDPLYYQEEVKSIYQGTPIIKIENKKRQKASSNAPKLTLSTAKELEESIPSIQSVYNIKTPFNQKETAYNTPHTTDFIFKVQVIDNKTVSVQEYIQFISHKKEKIKRVIPAYFNDELTPLDIELTGFEKEGKKINYNIIKKGDSFVFESSKEYPSGLHLIHLEYIVKNAIQEKNGVAQLFLSTTGKEWPYPINRFKAIVLYPYIPVSYQKGLLFGSNNLPIDKGVQMQTDIKGNTFYTVDKIIPAYGDVRIFESFDGKLLSKSFQDLFFQKYRFYIFSGISCLSLVLYLLFSVLYFKKIEKRYETVLKRVNRLSFMTLLFLQKRKVKKNLFGNLIKIKQLTKKRTLFVRFIWALSNVKFANSLIKRILKMGAIIGICFKHIVIAGVIYAVALFPLYEERAPFYFFIIPLIFFILIITLFYQKVLLTEMKAELNQFKEKLLSPHICFGLKESTIIAFYLRYYQTAYLLDIDKKLQEIIMTQNPNMTLPIIDEKDEK